MNKRKVIYPLTSLALATGLLFPQTLLTVEAAGYELEAGKINPYLNKDSVFLANTEREGIQYINKFRGEIGLSPLSVDPALSYSAQSHSNYLEKYKEVSHLQTKQNDSQTFTGTYPENRVGYYQYDTDEVEEVISFQTNSTSHSVDKLVDAPYHRVGLLNPNLTEVGIGYNQTPDSFNPTVINLGDQDGVQSIEGPIVYPYANQKEVKTSWYANESPNPLRFWNLNKVTVGYPISISVYGDNRGKLKANNVTLKDEKGNATPFYLVDGTKDGTLSSIFIIPQKSLKQGTKYTVDVKAEHVSKYNKVSAITKSWSFTTAGGYRLTSIDVLTAKNGVRVLKPYFNNGATNSVKYEIQKDGVKYQTYNEKGTNGYLGYKTLTDGEYNVIFTFTDSDQVVNQKVLIKGNTLTMVNESAPVEEVQEENEFAKERAITGAPLSSFVVAGERDINENATSTSFTFPFNLNAQSISPETLFMMDSKGNRQPIEVIINKNKLEIAFDEMKLKEGEQYSLYFDWYFLEGEHNEQLENPQKYILNIVKPRDLTKFKLVKEYSIANTAKGLRLPFSVAIDKQTINENTVFLQDKDGNNVQINRQLTSNNKALEIRFNEDTKLSSGQIYTLYIDNTIRGLAGNILPTASKFTIRVK